MQSFGTAESAALDKVRRYRSFHFTSGSIPESPLRKGNIVCIMWNCRICQILRKWFLGEITNLWVTLPRQWHCR
jgi:hypothetical protein